MTESNDILLEYFSKEMINEIQKNLNDFEKFNTKYSDKLDVDKLLYIYDYDRDYYYYCNDILNLGDDYKKINYILDICDMNKLYQKYADTKQSEINNNIEHIKCMRQYLPLMIENFKYKDCINIYCNTGYQPLITIKCDCHKDLIQHRYVFDELYNYLLANKEKYNFTHKTYEDLLKKFEHIEREILPFDSENIKYLCVVINWILIDHFNTKCITCQSCWGHINTNNERPWIKFCVAK